jgi:hypothetical protein
MKNSIRLCAIASLMLGLASLAHAQEGATRAEFECLTLANSSRLAPGGVPSKFFRIITCGHRGWTTARPIQRAEPDL